MHFSALTTLNLIVEKHRLCQATNKWENRAKICNMAGTVNGALIIVV